MLLTLYASSLGSHYSLPSFQKKKKLYASAYLCITKLNLRFETKKEKREKKKSDYNMERKRDSNNSSTRS